MSMRHHLPLALLALLVPAAATAQAPASNAPLSLSVHPAYELTVGYATAGWSDQALSRADGPALSLSRRVVGPVLGIFDLATLSGNTLSGSGVEPARHYLAIAGIAVAPELFAGGHLVRPEVGVGIGTLVSDPAADSSATRSQNAVQVSAGLDVGVGGRFTIGVHYRHVGLRLQAVATQGPVAPSTAVGADLVEVGLGVRF